MCSPSSQLLPCIASPSFRSASPGLVLPLPRLASVSSASPDPLIGRVIDGRYEVRARVARGGMATVYRALDKRLDREVALKVMHPYLSDGQAGAQFLARFRREARAAARLAHPGLVAVYDQGVDADVTYLTMEFIEGQDLRRYLTQRGTLPLGEALDMTRQILDALAVAHQAGMVHRDIKPENVMLTSTGQLKVADFGLARAVTEVTATSTGTVLGTVAYLGPEVITTGLADARTDLYAVGVLLYEMLVGTQPHTGETPIQVAYQHVHSDIPRLQDTIADIPTEVDEFVAALAARDRDERPADADAALVLLNNATRHLPPDVGGVRHELANAPAWDRLVTTSQFSHDSDATTRIKANRPGTTAQFSLDALDHASGPDVVVPPAVGGANKRQRRRAARREAKHEAKAAALASTTTAKAPKPPKQTRVHRRRRIVALVTVLLLLVASAGTYLGWYLIAGPGSYLTVPEGITGVAVVDAQNTLQVAGIGNKVNEVNDDVVAAGQVISATPGPGNQIKKDEVVVLVVSLGPVMYAIPAGLVGMDVAEATRALEANKITVAEPVSEYYDDVPAGQVTAISTGDATHIRHDESVTLTVSGGPAPVVIPDVLNATAEDARTTLEGMGLVYAESEAEYSDSVPEGAVISQTPTGGSDAHRTDTVTVTISKGRAPVEVPEDYYGQNANAAKAKLEALGFVVTIEKVYPVILFNLVASQSAEKGEVLPYGSEIILRVG